MSAIVNTSKCTLLAALIMSLANTSIFANTVKTVSTIPEFQDILERNNWVVAEFFNPDCPHCQKFKHDGTFDDLAREFGTIVFVEISSADGRELHKIYHINAFPTFIFFNNGKEDKRYLGYQTKKELTAIIRARMKSPALDTHNL